RIDSPRTPDTSPPATHSPWTNNPELPTLRLELRSRNGNHSSWAMDRALALVGRSDVCKVRLVSGTVSPIHCSLLRCAAGLLVLDLGGRDGIRINDWAVPWGILEEGDELAVGEFTLRIPPALEPGTRPGMLAVRSPASAAEMLTPCSP